jgi:hypothetical protein
MPKYGPDHEVDLVHHLGRIVTRSGERMSENIYANNGDLNNLVMERSNHIDLNLPNRHGPSQSLRQLLVWWRTTLAQDPSQIQQNMHRRIHHLRLSPQTQIVQTAICHLTLHLNRLKHEPHIPMKLVDLIVRLSGILKIADDLLRSRRLKLEAGHPNHYSKERWRWKGNDSKNGKRVKRSLKTRFL